MRRSISSLFSVLVVLVAATAATAQIVPQGGIVTLSGSMYGSNRDVATLPSGEFVVVWVDSYVGYVLGSKVSSGVEGSSFQVSTYQYSLSSARVDADDSGNFWVVWRQGYNTVRGRGFQSDETPLAADFAVGGFSANNPKIGARRSAGGFVSTFSDPSYPSGTEASGFDGTGTSVFGPVSAGTTYFNTKLGVDPAGNFMVVWSGDYLEAATFDSSGNSITPSIIIGSPASGSNGFDVSGLGTGGFVVAWSEYTYPGSYPDYYTVKARLASTTAPVGGEIVIAGTSNGNGVAVSGNSNYFVVVWQEDYSYMGAKTARRSNARVPFSPGEVTGQAFTSGGAPIGGPTVFNPSYYAGGYPNPLVNMNSGNQFTVLWNNYSTGYAQAGIVCPNPIAPTLSSPISGAIVNSPVTFSWTAAPGAISYDLYVGVGVAPSLLASGIAGTSHGPVALPTGNGSWYVIANFGVGCPTAQSVTETFQVCATATAPTLVSPIGGSPVASPVTFVWNSVAGAVSYDVYIGVGGSPVLAGSTAGTTFGPAAYPDGAGTWYVVANFDVGCPTAQSATESFVVSPVCPSLTPPTLLSPPNGGSAASPVTFQWSAVAGATGYELFVGVGTSPTLAGTTTGTSFSVSLPAGDASWYVVAKAGVSCPTATSSTHVFTVTVPFVCPTAASPSLLAPDDGAEFEVGDFIEFKWTGVPGASRYDVFTRVDGGTATFLGATANTTLNRAAVEGTVVWYVVASFGPGCDTAMSAMRTYIGGEGEPPPPPECGLTIQPLPSIVGEATTGENYVLRWEQITGIRKYHVQESANELFTQIISERTVEDVLEAAFSHADLTAPTPFFYRVAGIAECLDGDKIGPYSKIVRVVGLPKPEPSSTNPQIVTEFGNDEIVETSLFIPGFGESSKTTSVATFSVSSNEPWVTVLPPSGTLPPNGVTVTVQADPGDLGVGANTATLTVTRDDGLGKSTSGTTTTSVPVAVSLVTPVTPIGKTAGPPENSLIIPAVANVTGAASKWFSDVKVTNRATQPIIYQLNFSATDQSGIVEGKQTKVTIRPGQTVALDDVVRQWYGLGDLADGTNGALEIRPLNFNGKVGPEAAPMLATVASSRTYTRQESSLASYGQFIPAVPFSSFLKAGVQDALLMMQQVSQTESLRTNFGIVEGAGKETNVLLTAYDKQGTKLGEFPVSLKAGEHKQLNSLLALNGIVVEDGRMSAQIVSGEGAITAYASVVAAGTGDPALVPGVDPSSLSAKKYVLPGVADLRIGAANWRSDVRIFNPNQNTETVNVFFYPQGETTPLGPVEVQIQPGHIEVLPGVVESLFGQQDLGGALHIVPITGQATSLIVSGETYDVSELGKYGQFIPAVTEANAIGIGTPGLEIMQVESSAQFRTNLGIAEVTGQSATVQIQLTVPNSLIAPTRTVTLEGNEFEQLNGIVKEMSGGRDVYNGRLTVRVVGGAGRITAYGSTVDNQTQDATFSAGQ